MGLSHPSKIKSQCPGSLRNVLGPTSTSTIAGPLPSLRLEDTPHKQYRGAHHRKETATVLSPMLDTRDRTQVLSPPHPQEAGNSRACATGSLKKGKIKKENYEGGGLGMNPPETVVGTTWCHVQWGSSSCSLGKLVDGSQGYLETR